ncbi:hypothetical protein Q5P01_018080 [Channa striata]|uniref:Transcription regulator Myc N-terminal domain-containing protein n=1 Tax=Channa striata TaxID=64152 RepID=A0AA88M4A6_CHASR|nr:hypothetical protein Q5P01_018080 [Channa striata]
MWSGFSAGQQLERVVGERCAVSCPGTGAPAKVPGVTSPGRGQSAPADTATLSGLVTDCVDPAAVLTFPLIGGCKKQVSSGSESHSDSSEDEDDKDEDEEEIDVVTVEHKQQCKPRRLVNTRKPVTITVRADTLDPGMKRFHISIHQQQHNYAAPSPDTVPPPPEPPRKRVRQEASMQVTQPNQNSCYHQPRPGHTPLNLDNRKSHVTTSGVRSESPNLGASSLPPRHHLRLLHPPLPLPSIPTSHPQSNTLFLISPAPSPPIARTQTNARRTTSWSASDGTTCAHVSSHCGTRSRA